MVEADKQPKSPLVTVGEITSVYGVKGWVKVRSFTSPSENLFSYAPLFLKTKHGVKEIEIDEYRPQGKGLAAHIVGIDDRDVAQALCRSDIAIRQEQLPELEDEEFYWHQLIGLTVTSVFDGQSKVLGKVVRLMETGANDVLVVKGDPATGSLDAKERLIPYVPEQYVLDIDLAASAITVDWDPDF